MFQELHDYLYHYTETGGIPLQSTGIGVGLALIAAHAVAYLKKAEAQAFLKAFPRSYKWGVILLSIGFLWGMLCLGNMDMGEFHYLRPWFMKIVPVGFVLVLIYVKEFLAVRALGSLLLLVSGVVLEAAFLQPPASRLLLPIVAYAAWIIPGLYFVGMPYLMRDWITWITANEKRWNMAAIGGVVYGGLVLLAALLWY